jgi:hypothetical protein
LDWDAHQPKWLRGGSIWTGFLHQSAGEQGSWILPGNIPKLNRPAGFLRQQADLMMADTAMNVTKYLYCCILTEK